MLVKIRNGVEQRKRALRKSEQTRSKRWTVCKRRNMKVIAAKSKEMVSERAREQI